METIAGTVASRLEAVSAAVQKGVKDSAEVTSQITSQAQAAMSNELKNTREQISQIQNQLGQVQEAGQSMHETATKLENILGGAKNRGTFGETTLERLLEDSLPPSQYTLQYSFRSGKTADAVVHLRDKKLMAIDSKFPLDAFQRLEAEDEQSQKEARTDFVNAVKKHADSIAEKYVVPDEGTLELALMFVPSEAIYYELLRSTDSRKIAVDAYCRTKKIVPVSPNTLYAHLSVIAMGLRGMQIEENAKRLSANLDGLRKHLENFNKPFATLGTHLKNAQLSYNEAEKRLDKTTNTLENLLNSGEVHQLELEDEQGALTLPPPTAAKKTAG
jgi:DNA recombination protein RmuC